MKLPGHVLSTLLLPSAPGVRWNDLDAVAHGIQSGLRFLSLIVAGVGLLVTALLARSGAVRSARADGTRLLRAISGRETTRPLNRP